MILCHINLKFLSASWPWGSGGVAPLRPRGECVFATTSLPQKASYTSATKENQVSFQLITLATDAIVQVPLKWFMIIIKDIS